jgi:hypothetical protein
LQSSPSSYLSVVDVESPLSFTALGLAGLGFATRFASASNLGRLGWSSLFLQSLIQLIIVLGFGFRGKSSSSTLLLGRRLTARFILRTIIILGCIKSLSWPALNTAIIRSSGAPLASRRRRHRVMGRFWENLGVTNTEKCSTTKLNQRETRTERGQRDVSKKCKALNHCNRPTVAAAAMK